ncbi:class I SAM-dependent methyltransferase [Desulfosarcina sp.]|uniref:class I SAM-dependent methyltransferase n=1 Tax=Desulfosarcina sp. TaxID=2027861 RepID=UPI003564167E
MINTAITPKNKSTSVSGPVVSLNGVGRRLVLALLEKLQFGQLTLKDSRMVKTFGRKTPEFDLSATIRVHRDDFYRFCAFGGSVGAGEAFMLGHWTSPDLTAVVRIIVRNQQVFGEMDQGWTMLSRPVHQIFHLMRKNTPSGSRENIMAHYDLGNDFYRLFLDETMTYSSGIFETSQSSLKEASIAKYDRLCRKLDLGPDDHLLEIGTGWGGFALHASGKYGCEVTTTTISQQQYDFAKAKIEAAGLSARVHLLKSDYRELTGQYDKLVSIEMIEAVGHHYYDMFFKVCAQHLKEDGLMAIQAITIADHAFEQHKNSVDFIKRYIFPGSCIPSVTALLEAMSRSSDLRLFHMEDITPHYATTLRTWRERFFDNLDQVRELGFEEAFIRMWDYYLSYCEGGFLERYIGNVQMVFSKALTRRLPRI